MDNKLKGLKKILEQDVENEEIITDNMIVGKNVLKFPHMTIQLSSISQMNIGKIQMKIKVPKIAIMIFFISLVMLGFKLWIGVIGAGLSGYYIYYVYKNIPEDKIYLNIILNSGGTYNISFNDREFVEEVRTVIEKSFRGLIERDINIDNIHNTINDFSGSNTTVSNTSTNITLDKSISNSGNNNSGNSSIGHITDSKLTQKQSNINLDEFDWNVIIDSLTHVIESIKDNSSSVKKSSEIALEIARKGDKGNFLDYIKEHKNEFTSNVFQAIAGESIIALFKHIIF